MPSIPIQLLFLLKDPVDCFLSYQSCFIFLAARCLNRRGEVLWTLQRHRTRCAWGNELILPHTNPIQLLAPSLDRTMKVIPVVRVILQISQICSHPASSLTLVSANLSTVNKCSFSFPLSHPWKLVLGIRLVPYQSFLFSPIQRLRSVNDKRETGMVFYFVFFWKSSGRQPIKMNECHDWSNPVQSVESANSLRER